MSTISKIGSFGVSSLLLMAATSCANLDYPEHAAEAKENTLNLMQSDLSAEKYIDLLEGAEEAGKSIWISTSCKSEIEYWDSVKTDYLCKKAYLEGAQMVRDSIANAEKKDN